MKLFDQQPIGWDPAHMAHLGRFIAVSLEHRRAVLWFLSHFQIKPGFKCLHISAQWSTIKGNILSKRRKTANKRIREVLRGKMFYDKEILDISHWCIKFRRKIKTSKVCLTSKAKPRLRDLLVNSTLSCKSGNGSLWSILNSQFWVRVYVIFWIMIYTFTF